MRYPPMIDAPTMRSIEAARLACIAERLAAGCCPECGRLVTCNEPLCPSHLHPPSPATVRDPRR